MSLTVTEFQQVKTIQQLLQEYQVPDQIVRANLKHGEPMMDRHLLYECIAQGNNDTVYSSITPDTFYRKDIYFQLPECKKHTDITQELTNAYVVSKPMEGPYCPQCNKTNTSFMSEQTRSCDEGATFFVYCYNCNKQFKNPRNIRFPEKKK